MYKNLAIVSLFAVFSLNATAEEKFTFSLDTGVHHQWNQATTYAVDYLAPTKTSTDKSTLLIGGNAGISYALPSDSVFSNGIFGQNPMLSLDFGYFKGSSSASDRITGTNANSLLAVDGTVGSRWVDATWYSTNDYELADLNLSFKGFTKAPADSWSLFPEIGLVGRYFEQEYDQDSDFDVSTRRNVFDGDLESHMYGAQVSLNIQSPNYNGWSFGFKPSAKIMGADTDMRVIQDKDSAISSFADRLTVRDSKTSIVYEGKLEVGIVKQIENVSFGVDLYGSATSGTPYIDMPEFSGDEAKISTDGLSYSAGARISINFQF